MKAGGDDLPAEMPGHLGNRSAATSSVSSSITVPGERQAARSLLGYVCFFLFLGRAGQHLFLDAPFRIVLWNQDWLEPIVNRVLGMTWEVYAESPLVDGAINAVIRGVGILYLACSFAALPWLPWKPWRAVLLGTGAISLFLLACLYGIEKFSRVGEFLEYSSQWMSPILLILINSRLAAGRVLPFVGRVAILCTFAGHAAYAVGLYPVPGSFVDMVIMNLGVRETCARKLLFCMGALDLLVAFGMLLPYRFARPFLIYAVVWGGLTAFARFRYGFDITQAYCGARLFLPEILFRIPHAGIPLWLLMRADP